MFNGSFGLSSMKSFCIIYILKVYFRFYFSSEPNPPLGFWTKNTAYHFDLQPTSVVFDIFHRRDKHHNRFWTKI